MAWKPSYATVEELSAFVRVSDADDDAQITLALEASSRAIDRATSRQFGQADAPVARYYQPRWDRRHYRWIVQIDDLMTTSGLAVAYDTSGDLTYSFDVVDYRLVPLNAAADDRPWTEFTSVSSLDNSGFFGSGHLPFGHIERDPAIRVTARWGWSSVPDPIRYACLLQASRLLARRDAPFGVAGSPEAGSELRLLSQLDPDVSVAVRPFRRFWGAV